MTQELRKHIHAVVLSHYSDYRNFLKDELERRMQANQRYSLRAFSRDLHIAPQILSLVLKGKKGISPAVAIKIATRLNLSPDEVSYFHDLVVLVHARSGSVRDLAKTRLLRTNTNPEYRILQEDVFRTISDWHHYAILELTFTQEFRNDERWIAKRLGISALEVRQAIERLKRLGLIEETGGALRKSDAFLTTTQDIPSGAIRKFTEKMLEKANQALVSQSVQERDFGTMTLAINPDAIPKAKEMIRKFRRDLTRVLEAGSQKEVYVFATQFFRLSQKEK